MVPRVQLALCSALTVAAAAGFSPSALGVEPQGTAFTYHGEMRSNNTLVNGVYDVQFALYADPNGITQVGSTLCFDNVVVTDGRFTESLDFGAVFADQTRYLAVLVRQDTAGTIPCASVSGYVALGPVQAIAAAPNAQWAARALNADTATVATTCDLAADSPLLNGQPPSYYTNAANITGQLAGSALSGTYSNKLTLSNPANQLGGDGSALRNVKAASADHAVTATTAATASGATYLNGYPLSTYLSMGNATDQLQGSQLQGDYNAPINFSPIGIYGSGTYYGSGANLTGLNLSNVGGVLPSFALTGSYSSAITFANATLTGNGAHLTGLSPSNLTGAAVSQSMVPTRCNVQSQQGIIGPVDASLLFGLPITLPGSSANVNIPFSGTATLTWTMSAMSTAVGGVYNIYPQLDGPQIAGQAIPICFNQQYSHESFSGTVTFPISAGARHISLQVVQNNGVGHFYANNDDAVTWTLVTTH